MCDLVTFYVQTLVYQDTYIYQTIAFWKCEKKSGRKYKQMGLGGAK
jgi:hypothetical protein